MKQQIVVIHGGDTFERHEEYLENLKQMQFDLDRIRRKDWKVSLQTVLGDAYDVLWPRFPNPQNARYAEWKIYFDKIVPLLDDDVILIGHSLGGIFLAKYLAENNPPIRIKATMCVAAPYDDEALYSLTDFKINGDISTIADRGGEIFFYQSTDDQTVPSTEVEKYRESVPNAKICILSDRGHFNQAEFPEIVQDIKSL